MTKPAMYSDIFSSNGATTDRNGDPEKKYYMKRGFHQGIGFNIWIYFKVIGTQGY